MNSYRIEIPKAWWDTWTIPEEVGQALRTSPLLPYCFIGYTEDDKVNFIMKPVKFCGSKDLYFMINTPKGSITTSFEWATDLIGDTELHICGIAPQGWGKDTSYVICLPLINTTTIDTIKI